MKVEFGFKRAGLIHIESESWSFHLFVWNPEHWIWGHKWEEYDHCLEYYAFGPLFLLAKDPWVKKKND